MVQSLHGGKRNSMDSRALAIGNQGSGIAIFTFALWLTLFICSLGRVPKQLGTYYLEFVASHKLKYENLPDHLLAMAIRRLGTMLLNEPRLIHAWK